MEAETRKKKVHELQALRADVMRRRKRLIHDLFGCRPGRLGDRMKRAERPLGSYSEKSGASVTVPLRLTDRSVSRVRATRTSLLGFHQEEIHRLEFELRD